MKRDRTWTKIVSTVGLVLIVWMAGNATGFDGTISLKHDDSLFSMEFRNAEIKDVLRALGQEYHLNIIISNEIEGRLTLSFRGVSFEEALDSILRMNGLTSFREGNIIRVMRSPFSEGEEALITQMVPVNFASAKEVLEPVKGLLSKKGSLTADARTNTLVVRDVKENVEKIAQVIRHLDSKTPQVMIEARIVEVNTNYSRELGVQWGGVFAGQSGNRNFSVQGAGFKNQSTDTFARALTGGVGPSGAPFAVNLPASVGAGAGGGLGFIIGNISNTRILDIQLSALEDAGKGRILSNPRILTLNNKEAKISSGTEILIPTTSIVATSVTASTPTASGLSTNTGVTVIDAKLELTVTPHVTPDNQILMHIRTDKKDPDFTRQVQNIPPLTTRTAETDLLVRDKDTIVIGGIYTRTESNSEQGVPWLSKIPVLGWLFKKQTKTDSQNELMIFITPTVYHGG